MTDHENLVRELMEWCGGQPGLAHRAADAIKALVAERDDMHDALTVAYLAGAKDYKNRAEKAEADLAAAITALRKIRDHRCESLASVEAGSMRLIADQAIAAARADGGEAIRSANRDCVMHFDCMKADLEKAEADLAAARKALRKSLEYLGLLHQFMCDAHKCDFNEDRTNSWIAYMAHEVSKFSHDENTIAAARAEGGE